MTKTDVIRMAHEANFEGFGNGDWVCTTEEIQRFANLVAAAEREAILQMSADNWYKTQKDYDDAIRARGETK